VYVNAGLLGRFVREIAGAPAVLIGNSMVGMISMLEADARPTQLAA
jgi:hypothetical protein